MNRLEPGQSPTERSHMGMEMKPATLLRSCITCSVMVVALAFPFPARGQTSQSAAGSYGSTAIPPGTVSSVLRRGPAIAPVSRYGATNAVLNRPGRLVRQNSLSSRIGRLTPRTAMNNPYYRPQSVNIEEALAAIKNENANSRPELSARMMDRLTIRRQQVLADGWTYFRQGDYYRALSAFESAESLAPDDPIPAFGQLMATFANGHPIRSMHKLTKLARTDMIRPPGSTPMFEFRFSLRDAVESRDRLTEIFEAFTEFEEKNPDNPRVQALKCFMLWYSGSEESRIEARSIAARIKRTHPKSDWAKLHDMIEIARSRPSNDMIPKVGHAPMSRNKAGT